MQACLRVANAELLRMMIAPRARLCGANCTPLWLFPCSAHVTMICHVFGRLLSQGGWVKGLPRVAALEGLGRLGRRVASASAQRCKKLTFASFCASLASQFEWPWTLLQQTCAGKACGRPILKRT